MFFGRFHALNLCHAVSARYTHTLSGIFSTGFVRNCLNILLPIQKPEMHSSPAGARIFRTGIASFRSRAPLGTSRLFWKRIRINAKKVAAATF